MLTDLLLARSMGVDRAGVGEWLAERRRQHDLALPADGSLERLLRRFSAARSPLHAWSGSGRRRGQGRRPVAHRAVDAVYDSPHERTLDAIGLDYYDPGAARHFRVPGHRTAGGRNRFPTRELWDDIPDPAGLTRWLQVQRALTPGIPIWVVENGLCNRVHFGRSYPRGDGWDRIRYLRENIGAVVKAIDDGVPIEGYWHWSLVDNYEWGSFEPRFGLYGVDRHHGATGMQWLETDSLGDDAAGTYRRIIAGLRAGDRSVLVPE
jgi:beta-glucosidase